MANGKFIAYYRVSTQKQGSSGLGLEAQEKAVKDYLNGGKWELLTQFIEVESGKHADRPKLTEALALAKKNKATLIIAKLDRLSRNMAFIANLMESKVEFKACDFPTANKLTLHIMAAFAEHEREMISKRTSDALQAAKSRNQKLGWANPSRTDQSNASALGVAARKEKLIKQDNNLLPVIQQIKLSGIVTLQGIANELNKRDIKTSRGNQWYASSVRVLLKRHTCLDQSTTISSQ